MKYHMFFIILLFCSLSSCGSFELDTDRATDSRPIHFITKSPTRVGGHFVNNTYEVANMQIACDSLCNLYNLPRIILNPTDVYVRFLPKDSIEYRAILSLGTDFFDLPLTYEPDSVISYYRDPSVPDSLMTWQYTMVPFGVTLPNVEHEIIDTCYIPSESRLAPIAGFNLLLDELANRIANPDEDYFNDNNDHKIAHNRHQLFQIFCLLFQNLG